MAFAFDTLGYAKRLRDTGVPQDQAEAHAEAAREFIMAELVTRNDLDATRRELDASITDVRRDLEGLRRDFDVFRREVEAKFDAQTLRLTVRLGGIMAAGIAILGAIQRLH